jgi:aspartate racemase
MRRAIGILGGMGPEASVYMYKLLIEKAISDFGAKNNDDFPEILLHSIPVPDFISSNEEKGKALVMLQERVKLLNQMNLSCLAIACNTAHLLFGDLQKISTTPFISMIEEVARTVKKDKINMVGILGTPSTIRSGLYQSALSKYAIKSIVPKKEQLPLLGGVIRKVIAGTASKEDGLLLIRVANDLKRQGVEGIILGCTELPLVFPRKYSLPIYNSVEILASSLLKKYYKESE